MLVKRWRSETVRNRAAQGEALDRFVTQCQFAVQRVAEIGEMLVSSGQHCGEARRQIGVELNIAGKAVPALVGRARSRDAREALRAGGRGPAREGADAGAAVVDAALDRAVRGSRRDRSPEERPGRIGLQVAWPDLEILAAMLDADGNGQRPGEADVKFSREIEIGDQLAVAQPAGVEGTLAGGSEGGVERIAHRIIEAVVAVADRKVGVPAAHVAADAEQTGIILEIGADEGQEAVRRQRDEIGGRRRLPRRERAEVAVRRSILVAVIGGAEAVALAVGTEAVKLPILADRYARVDEEGEILGLGVAVDELITAEPQLTRIEGWGRRPVVIGPQVRALALGPVAVAIFGGEVHKASADRQAEIGPDRPQAPVAALALAVGIRQKDAGVGRVENRLAPGALKPGDVGDIVERRLVATVGRGRAAAIIGVAQLDVDHAGDRVRAILRGSAVAQHLHALDGEARDGVEIHGGAAAADRAVDVEQR